MFTLCSSTVLAAAVGFKLVTKIAILVPAYTSKFEISVPLSDERHLGLDDDIPKANCVHRLKIGNLAAEVRIELQLELLLRWTLHRSFVASALAMGMEDPEG